mmetsp:Transcript_19193/g.39411  ORF Transcript_19193/g.39411 Transcript_19193/m.39411 type:complete len:227 (-) Transcript_19193:1287-1967(-)|eukprot:CAMPEP_0201127154 /NCGR_PEP_ID=MMETSP0850-20130426/29019_1 /ASSEMBLY_ACC=CAM_ASM_000622 /TAXON_ID=183588 /ORGANISM="Pseudo-nitzschia fraudulenta, Strain WWA7" /LENGTH=226 /DNA_ID=CAMNT_0047395887 /DNA_START=107 /DNA_END=787 /DNA_ORIENTATION=+
MTVHSFHIFDRKGKTLYTKCYVKTPSKGEKSREEITEEQEQLSEQRKLVFGMLFSLRELSSSLSPSEGPGDLQLVKTGASILYNFETVSGLRFVLYTTADTSIASNKSSNATTTLQSSSHGGTGAGANSAMLTAPTTTGLINSATATTENSGTNFQNNSNNNRDGTSPAITKDIRSALKHIYENIWVTAVIRSPMYRPNENNSDSIKSTNFEAELDAYFKRKSWFR